MTTKHGQADAIVRTPAAIAALGYASFAELCDKALDMSQTKADALIGIVRRVRREDAVRIGQDRVAALLELADATPEEDTPKDHRQAPFPHACPGGHALAHFPQFWGSTFTFVHWLPQNVVPAGHAHAPATHATPLGQAW